MRWTTQHLGGLVDQGLQQSGKVLFAFSEHDKIDPWISLHKRNDPQLFGEWKAHRQSPESLGLRCRWLPRNTPHSTGTMKILPSGNLEGQKDVGQRHSGNNDVKCYPSANDLGLTSGRDQHPSYEW